LDELLERAEVVTVGIDGGGLDDLLGLAVIGRERETHRWLAWSRAWAHKSVLDLRKQIAQALEGFEADGDLVLVKNVGDDTAELVAIVAQVEESGLLDQVGVDPAGLGTILAARAGAGAPEDKDVGLPQGGRAGGPHTHA